MNPAIHPGSAVAGAALAATLFLALGTQQKGSVQKVPVLTPKEKEILGHMAIVYLDDGQGGTAKTIRITGVNLQLVNGLGATNGYPTDPDSLDPAQVQTNGSGNLILGYNEPDAFANDRTGSHNLVSGIHSQYSSFGGMVTGRRNEVPAPLGVVLGGSDGHADGLMSAVVGGIGNLAIGDFSAVAGGRYGRAEGENAAVVGGMFNAATHLWSTVVGGSRNTAANLYAVVCGGEQNVAMGDTSTITGGDSNLASGGVSWVGGGGDNRASAPNSAVAGGQGNEADGLLSSVSGGLSRMVSALNTSGNTDHDWVAGGLWQDN